MHSHETGKLSHLELVIMLTTALDQLSIDGHKLLTDDTAKIVTNMCQQAYELGKSQGEGKDD